MAFTLKNYMPGDVLTAEQMNDIQTELLTHKGKIEELETVNLGHVAVDDLDALRQYITEYVLNTIAPKSYAFISASLGISESALVVIHNGVFANGNADVVIEVNGSDTRATVNVWKQLDGQGGLKWTWGEWEYINPPMVYGVEYRTTERNNGLPVYVWRGSMPMVDAGQRNTLKITSDVDGGLMILSIDAIASDPDETNRHYPFPVFSINGDLRAVCTVQVTENPDGTNDLLAVVSSIESMLGYDAIVTVKYSK